MFCFDFFTFQHLFVKLFRFHNFRLRKWEIVRLQTLSVSNAAYHLLSGPASPSAGDTAALDGKPALLSV